MKRVEIKTEELTKILENHKHWLNEDCEGWENMRADLHGADLHGANLHGADLHGADLHGAILCGANLHWTNLCEAILYGANLHGAKNVPAFSYACPDTGSFTGWKKASGKIICLEIPADAKRSSAAGRKCRCDKAKVLSITELDGSPCELTEVMSSFDKSFIYRVGEMVSVDDFDEDRWNECSTGIHFFINRIEAVAY